MMTSREVVRRTLRFETPDRFAYDFPEIFGTDFYRTGLNPSPDRRPSRGVDDWGCVWECIGDSRLGEVKDSPLKDWSEFDKLTIPNIDRDEIWEPVRKARGEAGDKYIFGGLSSIFERVHFVRGFENTCCDIIEERDNLKMFVGLLAELNVKIIKGYANLGVDGVFATDDWGLQDRLMINPEDWRDIWKPAYRRVFQAAHNEGMDVWLHSCGYIADILGDLIEIGLDAIHMDQQENMGLEYLGEKFRGRITFFAPVDIQSVMAFGTPEEIKAYCHKMPQHLGTKSGGFIPCWYGDPVGAGHKMENVELMCREFLSISDEIYGRG